MPVTRPRLHAIIAAFTWYPHSVFLSCFVNLDTDFSKYVIKTRSVSAQKSQKIFPKRENVGVGTHSLENTHALEYLRQMKQN